MSWGSPGSVELKASSSSNLLRRLSLGRTSEAIKMVLRNAGVCIRLIIKIDFGKEQKAASAVSPKRPAISPSDLG
jgi:hypothetical protein